MKYKILSHYSPVKLSEKVNEPLSEGWRPYGSPFASNGAGGTPAALHQAVVKEDEE